MLFLCYSKPAKFTLRKTYRFLLNSTVNALAISFTRQVFGI